jgi:porin
MSSLFRLAPAFLTALIYTLPTHAQTLTGPIANVNQLTDIQPTDWAYQSLQSLAQTHNCLLTGSTQYRGNAPLTRAEFASQLNQCLEQIQTLLQTPNAISKTELETIQNLQTQFSTELANYNRKITDLETKVKTLDTQQFSPTAKLYGQTILGLQTGTTRI